ncbi:hypothetical protein [Kiloniella antarctica]|uniref:Uncharacterized protein n=1 Tax=Kiloniella antarctica TaxID=1550907 RepID=A0ABW5BJC5_9PROT
MTKETSSSGTRDAAIFSRGSLNFTYELLRETNAELASIIENIIQSSPLPTLDTAPNKSTENGTPEDFSKKKNEALGSDHFRIELRPLQIRAILEALLLHEQQNQDTQNICQEIMGQALIEDWMNLAYQIIAELPEEPESSTVH